MRHHVIGCASLASVGHTCRASRMVLSRGMARAAYSAALARVNQAARVLYSTKVMMVMRWDSSECQDAMNG
jgi:hypothetical protein